MSLALLQQSVSGPRPFVQPQETILGGMNGFTWNMNATRDYQPHMHYSMPTPSTPAPQPGFLPTNLSPSPYMNAQHTQPGSSSYDSWDVLHTTDYNSSQRTSEELQHSYLMEGYASPQLHQYNGPQASYIPTDAIQVESLPEDNSIALGQITSTAPFDSRLATSSDGNIDDGLSNGVKPNPKKRHLTPDQQRNAKIMRKVGSCIRCRIMKTPVSFPLSR